MTHRFHVVDKNGNHCEYVDSDTRTDIVYMWDKRIDDKAPHRIELCARPQTGE